MATLIELPPSLKPLAEPLLALVADLGALVDDPGALLLEQRYEDVEVRVAALASGVERACHAALLSRLVHSEERLIVGGQVHHRAVEGRGTYRTMAGPVEVQRWLYRPAGTRNAPTVDPVGVQVGVVGDGWLPACAAAMAHKLQMGTSREAAQQAEQDRRFPYSRSSFESVAHAVGRLVVDRMDDIDDAIIESVEIPAEAKSVAISVDRVTLPMEEPRKRPVGRPRKGAPKRPVTRAFRQAYVGTVSLCDDEGEVLFSLRYGRMPKGDAGHMVHGMAVDVKELLGRRPDLKVACIADGAPEMWNLLEGITEAELGVDVVHVLDFWHLVEKLGAAARVISSAPEPLLRRWKLALLNRDGASARIHDELTASGREWVKVGDAHPVHEAMTYLVNHGARLGYREARARGLPIGSGPVEASCKSLVGVRMKRAGSRWKAETGDHILQLRARALSGAWAPTMRVALSSLRSSVEVMRAA